LVHYNFGRFYSIHFGHLDVHQDEAVGSVWALAGLFEGLVELLHSNFAVGGLLCFKVEMKHNQVLQCPNVKYGVVHNQDPGFALAPSSYGNIGRRQAVVSA
jgi:hypothetical protein